VDFTNRDGFSRYRVYQLDSLIVISIEEIQLDRQAVIDDDYHKTQILSDLDLRLVGDSQEPYAEINDLTKYKTLRDSLVVNGRTAITLKHDSVSDEMNFKNSRLNGDFRRSMNDQLLFEGKFRNGIEDSVWNYYDDSNKVVTRKYFKNGEVTRTEQFENAILVSEQKHQTRDDIVRNKYFHLGILTLLLIAVLARLILNFRKSDKDHIIHASSFLTVLAIFGLPFVVLTLAKIISSWIPYSYSNFFLELFIEVFFIYLITAPLFLFVLAVLKLRSKFDLALYILLFSLSVVLIEEWIQLKVLV